MNHTNGEWLGQYAAYAPWDGLPEACWKDGAGKLIKHVYTRCAEAAVDGGVMKRRCAGMACFDF